MIVKLYGESCDLVEDVVSRFRKRETWASRTAHKTRAGSRLIRCSPTSRSGAVGCDALRQAFRAGERRTTMIALTVELPDQLVDEARDAGLLSPEEIEAMFRERLKKRGVDELLDAAERLAATPNEPAMSLEEIQLEVNAIRAERRGRRS